MTDILQNQGYKIQGHIQRLEAGKEAEQEPLILYALRYAHEEQFITDEQFHRAQDQLECGAYVSAALTLVPKGWYGTIRFGDWPSYCNLKSPSSVALCTKSTDTGGIVIGPDGHAATPSLALCIAGLKARKAVE